MQILNKIINSGYNIEFLYLLTLVSVLLGISVIIAKNPVISVLFLIGLFIGISIYLMLSGLYFLGLSYLLVYVGAVSILFLFILMLINVRISELVTEGKNSLLLSIFAVLLISFSFNDALYFDNSYLYYFYLFWSFFIINNNISVINYINNKVNNIYSTYWDNTILEISHISAIGNILYTNLFIFLIITSLILLLVMVGCIIITIKTKIFTVNNDPPFPYSFINQDKLSIMSPAEFNYYITRFKSTITSSTDPKSTKYAEVIIEHLDALTQPGNIISSDSRLASSRFKKNFKILSDISSTNSGGESTIHFTDAKLIYNKLASNIMQTNPGLKISLFQEMGEDVIFYQKNIEKYGMPSVISLKWPPEGEGPSGGGSSGEGSSGSGGPSGGEPSGGESSVGGSSQMSRNIMTIISIVFILFLICCVIITLNNIYINHINVIVSIIHNIILKIFV